MDVQEHEFFMLPHGAILIDLRLPKSQAIEEADHGNVVICSPP